MKVITVRNVHEALPAGLEYLEQCGVRRGSRNGTVIVAPGPVTTHYLKPRERVLFWAERDANPFFHFFESLWMLAGRNDLKYLTQFLPRMKDFSDDGETLHGAYGYRWMHQFSMVEDDGTEMSVRVQEIDQLSTIINMLKRNPEDRRCVLQMWDAAVDLGSDGKDLPCNTQVYFLINRDGDLDMTVCCRSNDMILGAYGANAVHFSFLQEYMAAGIGVLVGGYWQISNNFHVYDNADLKKVHPLLNQAPDPFRYHSRNPYHTDDISPFPLVSTPLSEWRQDLAMFLDVGPVVGLRDPFFRRVAGPLYHSFRAYKDNKGEERYDIAMEILEQCQAKDWALATVEWLTRRRDTFIAAQAAADFEEE